MVTVGTHLGIENLHWIHNVVYRGAVQ